MIWYVIVGFFAAAGLLSLLWLLKALFLPASGAVSVAVWCGQGGEVALLRRQRFLRELGLCRCTLVLVDSRLPEETKDALRSHFAHVEFATTEEWLDRLKERQSPDG